jgi:hypothetical protein
LIEFKMTGSAAQIPFCRRIAFMVMAVELEAAAVIATGGDLSRRLQPESHLI